MRSLANLQSLRSAGVGSTQNSGLTVSWTYAGGATVAAPTTIWSENTGDAANQILVQYNGAMVYLTKRIAGANTYVTVGATALAAGTYPIKIILNSDNTIKLVVNGTASLDGYGTELVSPYPLDMQAQTWTGSANITINSATQATVGNTSTGYFGKGLGVVGRIHRLFGNGTVSSGLLRICNSTSVAIIGAINTNLDYIHPTSNTTGFVITGHTAGTTATGLTFSKKEIYNNTSTTAIPWATVL
jgi:hypothetical protein